MNELPAGTYEDAQTISDLRARIAALEAKLAATEKERAERERSSVPTVEMLNEMAYHLCILPRGEIIPVQILAVLKEQYIAAIRAAGKEDK